MILRNEELSFSSLSVVSVDEELSGGGMNVMMMISAKYKQQSIIQSEQTKISASINSCICISMILLLNCSIGGNQLFDYLL